MSVENNNTNEIIDNEKINAEWIEKYLDSFEWKSEKFIKERKKILEVLNKIDNQNPSIDIDMQYDKKTWLYYILNDWKINGPALSWENFINRFWWLNNIWWIPNVLESNFEINYKIIEYDSISLIKRKTYSIEANWSIWYLPNTAEPNDLLIDIDPDKVMYQVNLILNEDKKITQVSIEDLLFKWKFKYIDEEWNSKTDWEYSKKYDIKDGKKVLKLFKYFVTAIKEWNKTKIYNSYSLE